MRTKLSVALLITAAAITSGCETQHQRDAERAREDRDKNSAAYKAGQAAHEVAREAGKAAAAAARQLEDSARKAREGWKEQERKDRGKK